MSPKNKMKQLGGFALLCGSLLFGCGEAQTQDQDRPEYASIYDADESRSEFMYDLKNPTETLTLDGKLDEISGISPWKPGVFACVQDEEGRVYFFKEKDGEVTENYRFAKDEDFEDIVVHRGIIYALRSDGKIYELHPKISEKWEEFEHQMPLTSKNNTEGLAISADGDKLLIACKGRSGIKDDIKGYRGIYSFDLATKELDPDPVVLIDRRQLIEIAGQKLGFAPSGIAVHPKTKDLYVISTVGKVLVVLDTQNHIKHLQSLRYDHFMQPEGICFLPDGTLYISNEGRGDNANFLKFKMK